MRFEDPCEGWTSTRLTQIGAARLPGGCPRTVRRTLNRYEEDGLIDKPSAQVSHRRAPVDEVMRLVDRYRNRRQGWNVKHYYSGYKYAGYPRKGATQHHRGEEHAKAVWKALSQAAYDRSGGPRLSVAALGIPKSHDNKRQAIPIRCFSYQGSVFLVLRSCISRNNCHP